MSTHADPSDIAAIALLDEPVRRAVYEWVVAQARPVGREETARALRITRPLATFHLDRLAAAGLLGSDYRRLNQRTGPGAGRPARVYWRADTEIGVTLPERRYALAADTLARALESDPDGGARVAAMAGREAGHALGDGVRKGSNLRSPARLLDRALSEQGYEPAPPGPDGTIRLRNCPFHALVDEHRPLVCGMNLAMAEGLSESIGPELPYRPVLDPQPGFCCVAYRPA